MRINTAMMTAQEKDDFLYYLASSINEVNPKGKDHISLPIFHVQFPIDRDIYLRTAFSEAMDNLILDGGHPLTGVRNTELQKEFIAAVSPLVLPVQNAMQAIVAEFGGEVRESFPTQSYAHGYVSASFAATPSAWRRIVDLPVETSTPAWGGGPIAKSVIAEWKAFHDTVFGAMPSLKERVVAPIAERVWQDSHVNNGNTPSEIMARVCANNRRAAERWVAQAHENIERRRFLRFLDRNEADRANSAHKTIGQRQVQVAAPGLKAA